MANIFKQYKDSRTSASLFTETGSFPSALRSSATVGPNAAALDMHVSRVPVGGSYWLLVHDVLMICFDKRMDCNTWHIRTPWVGTDHWKYFDSVSWYRLLKVTISIQFWINDRQIDGHESTSLPDLCADSVSAGISQAIETGASTWDATHCGEDVVTQEAWGMGTSSEPPDFEKLYSRYFEMWRCWFVDDHHHLQKSSFFTL